MSTPIAAPTHFENLGPFSPSFLLKFRRREVVVFCEKALETSRFNANDRSMVGVFAIVLAIQSTNPLSFSKVVKKPKIISTAGQPISSISIDADSH
jgi:hypothetical protein